MGENWLSSALPMPKHSQLSTTPTLDTSTACSFTRRPCDSPPHSIRTAHRAHPFKALPHLHAHHRLDVSVITKSNLRPEESSVLSLFGHRQWGSKNASNLQVHGLTSLRISLIERVFITSRPMFPLWVVQLLSLGHPCPTFCCCPRWKRNPKATFVNVHSI